MDKTVTGFNYLKLSLLGFLTLGLEGILASFESKIYSIFTLEVTTIASHYIITCILWSVSSIYIFKYAMKKYNFKIKDSLTKIKVWQWILIVIVILFSIVIKYQSWNGFKVLKEFNNLGIWRFSIQYLYYFIETVLFTIIIIFGQKAFEKWFRNDKVPYGGILCALTWGISHIFSRASIEVGLAGVVFGFFFGSIYILINRDVIKTFIVLFLMFIL